MRPLFGPQTLRWFTSRGRRPPSRAEGFKKLITQFLGSIIAFDGLGDNRASRVATLEVLRLGFDDAGDVAGSHAREQANE